MQIRKVFLLVLFAPPFPLSAQFEYGEILGTVRDPSGAIVSGASVVLRSGETNVERKTLTNDEGMYAFAGLRIGSYTLKVEHSGFKPAQANVSALRVGDRLRVDILLETDTSSRGQVVGLTEIRELSLNKRDYTQLVLLAPGTAVNPRQRIGGAININGNRKQTACQQDRAGALRGGHMRHAGTAWLSVSLHSLEIRPQL
jgi:hypothetical protein